MDFVYLPTGTASFVGDLVRNVLMLCYSAICFDSHNRHAQPMSDLLRLTTLDDLEMFHLASKQCNVNKCL